MTTSTHDPLTGSAVKPFDFDRGGFEASSGLSAEEAERLAAAFKPSWEFDEAPFAPMAPGNGALDGSQIDALAAGGVRPEVISPPESRTVPPHAPPPRVETNEPEVSVIIDRSITAAALEAPRPAAPPSRPPPPAQAPFAAPAFAAPAPQQRPVAPVFRPQHGMADESIQIPASLTKSNRGLFIGLAVAVAAAALVFVVHGAMSSDDTPATTAPTATAAAAVATTAAPSPIPPPPPVAAIPPPPPVAATPPPPPVTATPPSAPVATPQPATVTPVRNAAPVHAAPRPAPPPPHRPAPPKSPTKPSGGGIVRDVPF